MKPTSWKWFGILLLTGAWVAPLPRLAAQEGTVELATDALRALALSTPRGIPPTLLQDAQGVAVIPNVVKAGLVFGGRFGRGVVLLRQPDGCWSNPVFLTLLGGGVGWQIGVQSTDVVLVFKTSNGLAPILRGRGKLTLGADVAVAAGPVGRQAEAATDAQLKAEIYSYSRSRGLFAGLSLEGSGLVIDRDANEVYYRLRGGHPIDVLNLKVVPASAENLKGHLSRLSAPPPVFSPLPIPPPNSAPPVIPPR